MSVCASSYWLATSRASLGTGMLDVMANANEHSPSVHFVSMFRRRRSGVDCVFGPGKGAIHPFRRPHPPGLFQPHTRAACSSRLAQRVLTLIHLLIARKSPHFRPVPPLQLTTYSWEEAFLSRPSIGSTWRPKTSSRGQGLHIHGVRLQDVTLLDELQYSCRL